MCKFYPSADPHVNDSLPDSCQRLSLTPLCYLWQRDQRELMSEMIAAGVEAILIKVAGIGLLERHLGKTLAQMEPTFHKLVRFRSFNEIYVGIE